MKTINELVNKSFPSKPRNFAIGNNDMPYHKLFSADEKKKALESFT